LSIIQSITFLTIVLLVTARTLLLRNLADKVSPQATAWAIGAGTTCVCLLLLPVAWVSGSASFSSFQNLTGIVAGLAKGVLLTLLITVQQQIIGRSMSATAYVFPVAVGGIAVLDDGLFNAQLSSGGLLSIVILFMGGLFFSVFGHLGSMPRKDTLRFFVMVAAVIGFAVCDKVGIPSAGWFTYLLYTGVGNMLSAKMLLKTASPIGLSNWALLALGWTVPELFFNFALSGTLPLSYGYFAISLRVPLLMAIAFLVYREGHGKNQIFFGLLSIVGTGPLFFK
jgi:hypothetical protein